MLGKITEKYFTFVKQLIPERGGNRPSLGLDIGTHSCKIIEIIPTDETFTVLNWAVEPVGQSGPAGSIKRIFEKLNIQPKSISTAISGQGTLIRYIEMPKMPLAEAKQSFALEADKYFPFARDQIYTDCFIIDNARQDNKMSLLVAAAKKELIENRVKLLENIGLETNYIGVNSVAIANVFSVLSQKKATKELQNDAAKSKPEAIAVLDVGNTVSSLIILKDDVPRFTRDIFIGGREFNQRISNVLGVDIKEAEKIKRNPGGQLESILNASDSILMNLVSEVRLSFDYFMTEFNTPVSCLYLTGGASSLEKVADFFNKNLDIPIKTWNPFASLKLLSSVAGSDIHKHANYLGVALGLALYQHD